MRPGWMSYLYDGVVELNSVFPIIKISYSLYGCLSECHAWVSEYREVMLWDGYIELSESQRGLIFDLEGHLESDECVILDPF